MRLVEGKKEEKKRETMLHLIEIKEVCTALPLLIFPRYHTLLGHTHPPTLERAPAVHQSSRTSLPLRGKKTGKTIGSFKVNPKECSNEKKECAVYPQIPRTA